MELSKLLQDKRTLIILSIILLFASVDFVMICGQQSLDIHENNHLLYDGSLESNGILYHLPHFWYLKVVSNPDNAWVKRAPSMVFGLVTIILTYLLGARWGGRRLGLLSAFMLTTNIMFLAFGTNHRFYAFDMMMVVLATHLWWTSLRNEDSHKAWWLYALSMAGVMSSMFISTAIAIPHAIFYIAFSRRKWRAFGRFTILAILLLMLLTLLCLHDPTSYGILSSTFELNHNIADITSMVLCDGFRFDKMLNNVNGVNTNKLPDEYFEQLRTINRVFKFALIAGFCWPVCVGISRRLNKSNPAKTNQTRKHTWSIFPLVLLGIALAIGSLIVFSIFGRNLISANYLSWTLPFLAIMFAQSLNAPRYLRRWIFPIFCLGIMYGTPLLVQGSHINGPGCKDLRQTVETFARPNDIIILDDASDMPGLQDYGLQCALMGKHIEVEEHAQNTPLVVAMAAQLAEMGQPIRIPYTDYMQILSIAPRLSFMHGRRVWVLYKSHYQPADTPLVQVFDKHYDPSYSSKVSEVLWHCPEGLITLLIYK